MNAPSILRRTVPLVLTGFFSSFSNCGFKVWAVLAVAGSQFDYFKDSAFLLSVTAVCLLPPLLLPLWSGYCADRFPKRYVVISAKLLELPLFAFAASAVSSLNSTHNGIWILSAVLLHSIVAAFYAPAFDGLQPESFKEVELSGACGRITSAETLGYLAGAAFILTAFHFNICQYLLLSSIVCSIFSAIAIFPVISPVQEKEELAYPFKKSLKLGVKALCARTGILTAALGDICFIGLGVTALLLLVFFGKYVLGLNDTVNLILLQVAPAAGFLMGCFCGGIFSKNKIELGMVPLGALGMALSLPMLVLFPGEAGKVTVDLPGESLLHIQFFTGAFFWAMFAGFSGGLLVIPLRTYALQNLRPEWRGAALAVKNAAAFLVCSVTLLLAVSCALGGGAVPELPPLLYDISCMMPRIPFQMLLIGFGLVTFGLTLFTMWKLPNFMLRFIVLALGHSIYRLKITGAENIPERGGALLLCNHVSAIDSILISACTSRQIRFLLYEEYFSVPLLGAVIRATGFFNVPSAGKSKSLGLLFEKIRHHLESGGLVCVFPEGKLTGNGLVGEFKHGFEKMLPENADIPIIPVNISFTWGSLFSNFSRPGIRKKLTLPFFSAVTFGAPLPRSTPLFEIRQKIVELGADAAEHTTPGEVTLHYAAVKLAKRTPLRKLFSEYGGSDFSAFKLVLEAALLSRRIRRKTSSAQKYIGILLPNSIAEIKVFLAILLADKIPVPLNYSTSQEVFDCSIAKADIKLVITSRKFSEKLKLTPENKNLFIEDLETDFSFADRFLMGCGLLLLPAKEFMNMLSPLSAFDLQHDAVLLFSSGSTGNPKGVRLSHHNLNSNARSVAQALAVDPAADRIVGNLPLFHSFGLNVCFWMPLLRGVPVVYTANPLDAQAVRSVIYDRQATLLFATPSFLQKYLHRCTGEELRTLRLIATGAEKLRADIAGKVRTLTEGRLEIVECYGCTELSPVVSINLTPNVAELGSKAGVPDSIGQALENISVRILDPLQFTPVAPGEEGILCVKGALVMKGYLHDEVPPQEIMAGEYYKTGDIAKMDECGHIHICGRLSRFSKIAGEMVPHEMVERIINEICACENRCVAVCGIPDPVKGEALLVLYTDDMPMTPEEVVEQLRERSISNLWIPKAKNFRKTDNLPLLGSGKLDLAQLRKTAGQIASENS